jgi:protein TonB
VRDVAPTTAPDRIADETPRPPGMPSTSLNVVGAGSPIGVAGAPVDLGAPPPVVTPAPPRPRTPMRVGGIIQPPARVTFVAPVYPAIAKLSRVEGDVGLEATIDETGRVTKVVVRQSVPLLDKAAIEAVSLWRYTPTILNGEPVAVILTVTVRFKIN